MKKTIPFIALLLVNLFVYESFAATDAPSHVHPVKQEPNNAFPRADIALKWIFSESGISASMSFADAKNRNSIATI